MKLPFRTSPPRDRRLFVWEPQKDITAYELAECMRMLIPESDNRREFDLPPKEAQRHFRIIEEQ